MQSKDMVPEEDLVTDLLYMSKFRYLVIGCKTGEIRVNRIVLNNPYITKFTDHSGEITSLVRHPRRENQFISASTDSTLRIWCLGETLCRLTISARWCSGPPGSTASGRKAEASARRKTLQEKFHR